MCRHCNGYGYVQEYWTRVIRVYCDCEAGDKRIKEAKEALVEVGLDPNDPVYQWRRRNESKTN